VAAARRRNVHLRPLEPDNKSLQGIRAFALRMKLVPQP